MILQGLVLMSTCFSTTMGGPDRGRNYLAGRVSSAWPLTSRLRTSAAKSPWRRGGRQRATAGPGRHLRTVAGPLRTRPPRRLPRPPRSPPVRPVTSARELPPTIQPSELSAKARPGRSTPPGRCHRRHLHAPHNRAARALADGECRSTSSRNAAASPVRARRTRSPSRMSAPNQCRPGVLRLPASTRPLGERPSAMARHMSPVF
jgi:hypothetical protein